MFSDVLSKGSGIDPLMFDQGEREFLGKHPTNDTAAEKIANLDLSDVKAKLSSPKEMGGDNWTKERCDYNEMWYKRFLCMMLLHPHDGIAPITEDIDQMWHTHILHTNQYHEDCNRIFGAYIHHLPCNVSSPKKVLDRMTSSMKRTVMLFKKHYGELPKDECNSVCSKTTCRTSCGDGKCCGQNS